jgi:hypothetical protein
MLIQENALKEKNIPLMEDVSSAMSPTIYSLPLISPQTAYLAQMKRYVLV